MKYKSQILAMMQEDYPDFVQSLLSIELNSEKKDLLQSLYQNFMQNDGQSLLHESFYRQEETYQEHKA